MKGFAITLAALFSLQLLVGCGANPAAQLELSKNNTTLSTRSANLSGYQTMDYRSFRDLWDRTCGLEASVDPAAYHGKKYAITAIMEYEPCTTLSAIRWNALLYEPTGRDYSNAFYVLVKTFLTENQANKFYQNLGGVRADDVIGGAVDEDTGERTTTKHAKASPITVYFTFDAHRDQDMEKCLKVDAIKTPNGIVHF